RKTATKELNRLTRKHDELAQSDTTEGDAKAKKKLAKLVARIHTAKVNLNYTIYYPLTEKYISIYAEKKQKKKGNDQNVDEEQSGAEQEEAGAGGSTVAERTAMWRVVEKCMEEGTLDLLREGKLNANGEKKSKAERSDKSDTTSRNDVSGKKGSKEKFDKSNVNSGKADTRKERSTKHAPPQQEEEDESDGGFFEM
ncbi:hypothetical protein BJX68DRAFT_265877, partial [Aspergillus pseudodeflectus]